jgi:hypothetical protein
MDKKDEKELIKEGSLDLVMILLAICIIVGIAAFIATFF